MNKSLSKDFAILQKSTGLRPSGPSIANLQAALKKKALGSLTWMRIDGAGNAELLEADKYAIMHRVGIHARDLRILDPLLSYPSTLLGRERAIVLNLEHIKAIITADEVLLRNPSDENVIPFIEELRRRLVVPTPGVGGQGGGSGAFRAAAAAARRGGGADDAEGTDGGIGPEGELERRASPGPRASSGSLRRQRRRSGGGGGGGGGGPHTDDGGGAQQGAEVTPPFEFRALEVILEAVCSFLDARTTELENAAYPALDELTSKVSILNLERVRKLKNGMSRLTNRVGKVKDELEQLLDDDDDMADMFLTRKLSQPGSPGASVGGGGAFPPSPSLAPTPGSRGGSRYSAYGSTIKSGGDDDDDIEELEQLLEAYFVQVEGTLNKLSALREYIDDTEDYINIQLDNHRNQLIQLELILNMGVMAVGIYAVVASVFGMNLPYSWNTDSRAFNLVWSITLVVCLVVFVGLVGYARVKRIIS